MSTSPFFRLWLSNPRYRFDAIKASAFTVANTLCDVAPEILIGIAVDVVVQQRPTFLTRLGINDAFDQILALAGLTLIIWIGESLTQYAYELGWRNLAQRVQHDLRLSAYRHVQHLDLEHFEDRNAGALAAILGDDINQLERFLDKGASSLIHVVTTAVSIGAVFFYLAPAIALWAMIPIPIILLSAFYYQKKAEPRYAGVRAMAGAIAGKLTANLGGITTIKSQTTENYEAQLVEKRSLDYLEANRGAIVVSSAFIPLIRMAILTGFLGTLVLGGKMAIAGELAVGSFGVLVFLTQRLLWPFTRLAETVDQFQRARASTRRVLDLLALPVRSIYEGRSLELPKVAGKLAFRSVSFTYPGREPLLDRLELDIPAGHTVALVGATGSGKSTIAKLLLRFYETQRGLITLDDTSIRELKIHDLRRAIGFVGQEFFLFAGSIRDNIAYGSFDRDHAHIEHAARIAHADEFIRNLPEGYDTKIGDGGLQLSGGQRQRLAIARAVLKNPRILILDEATSAVDNESERLIQSALQEISRERTTLIIAHRLSTIRHANQIHVLDGGKIVESGTHDELVARGKAYSGLWRVQTGEAFAD